MNAATHQQVKDTAALKQKKFRDETGLLLVEGKHPIEEAHRAGLTMTAAFVLPDHEGSMPDIQWPVSPVRADETAMGRMGTTTSPPPCLAVFKAPRPVSELKRGLTLVLDGIQDPGNLGTLARSAVAFGVQSLVLTGNSVEPYNPKVIRSSAGLIFALPVLEIETARLSALLGEGWRIYGTTGHAGATSYREVDYSGACAIVLGNEGRGVSADLRQGLTMQPLTIPMADAVESLNVAVSGSIILAQAAVGRKSETRL